jgi:deoxyribose-phosphate aldolase
MDIAKYLDHTLLKPDAPFGDYTAAVRDCVKYNFAGLCVNPFFVKLVNNLLQNHPECSTKIASVISFPLGLEDILSKREEVSHALLHGAKELDLVVNISSIKSGDYKRVADELREVREESQGAILKVILEVGLLTTEEIEKTTRICIDERVNYIKTSTGVNIKLPFEETLKYSKLLVDLTTGASVKVKASGGIKELNQVKQLIDIGVHRIGTSNSIKIMEECLKNG